MRSFIHVYDMARAIIFALDNHNNMTGEVYNIGNDNMNYTKENICELLAGKINY